MAADPNSTGQVPPESTEGRGKKSPQLKRLGRYLIKKKIGSGGMGAVFLAQDTQLKRTVALKVLPREKAENPTLVKRFHSEAQSAARLRHENIVTIYEADEADGFLYLALEYIDGTDVQRLIEKRGYLPVARTIDIVKQVARALAHLDEQGIVHRDIKPSNIMIRRDRSVKLADLGLARSMSEAGSTGITRDGTTVGTVDYMSPEQARDSKAADIRSDLYSLGCTWYHMLTGVPPFNKGTLTNKLAAHASGDLPDPREKNEAVPEAVVAVLHRLMAKAPQQRYDSPEALLEDLDSAHLSRSSLSQQVLAGLAGDEEARPIPQRSPKAEAPAPAPRTLPPPGKSAKKGKPERPREKVSIRIAPGKVILAIGAVVLLILGVSWLMSSLGEALDQTGDPERGLAEGLRERNEALETNGDGSKTQGDDGDENGNKQSRTQTPPRDEIVDDGPQEDRNGSDKEATHYAQPVGRDGEEDAVPGWVREKWSPSSRGPKTPPELAKLQMVSVGGSGPDNFETLREALRALRGGGGMVVLKGDGPFRLPATTLTTGGQLYLVAGPESRPIVTLSERTRTGSAHYLHVMNTDVTIDGLDVVVVGDRIGDEGPLSLFRVTAGDLVVRDTSVTMLGTRRGDLQAFVADGRIGQNRVRPSRSTRLLFEHVRTRGNGLTPLGIHALDVESVVSDSLFVTGGAPACRVSSGDGAAAESARRALTFLSTIIVSPGTAFHFSGGGSDRPIPATTIQTINSVVATGPQSAANSAMLTLVDWPTNRSREPDESRLRSLNWSAEHSMYLGWRKLIEGRPALPIEVDDAASWQTTWRQPSDPEQFQPTRWPAQPLGNVARVEAQQFRVSDISGVVVLATDRGEVGCDLNAVTMPDRLRVERTLALLDRPQFPNASIADPAAAKTIEVDATREDLGRIASDPGLPDGSLILVTGYGYRRSSSVHVKGKTLKIRFEPHERGPLIISPQEVRPNDAYRAFITVEDGRIEIENALFRIRSSATKIDPLWMLSAVSSEFSLRNTYLSGPALQSNRYQGLIELRGNAGDAAARKHSFGLIRDCTLVSKGRVIEAASGGVSLIARNSVLAGLDDLVRVAGGPEQPPGQTAFDISQSTLSAGAAFFRIDVGVTGPARRWLRFYVSECLFGPPVASRDRPAPQPLLFRCGSEFDRRGQAVWWGSSNGFASEIERYLDDGRLADPQAAQDFEQSWFNAWGESHVERPLQGRGKVLLDSPLPSASDLLPTSFTLQEDCAAADWLPGDRPLGANGHVLPHPEVKRD